MEDNNMEEMSYGKAVAELEAIVRKMQSDNCDIDDLAALTARSLELLKICRMKLTSTDEKLKKCLEELG